MNRGYAVHKWTALAAIASIPLTVFVPLAAVMYITEGRPRWWMVLAATLLVAQGALSAYRAYHLYRTGALTESRTLDVFSRVLLLAALFTIFVPLYGSRLASLFR
jgi:hypothetical protein